MLFLRDPTRTGTTDLTEMYEKLIKDIEDRINVLVFAEMILVIADHMPDADRALHFLEMIEKKTQVSADVEASLCIGTSIAKRRIDKGDLATAKEQLAKYGSSMDQLDNVSFVHATYYKVAAEYYKKTGQHADYYRSALRYLGCIELAEQLSPQEQAERAADLCLAGILGEGIYNFGELLAHGILDSVKDTELQWLVDLLYAFNSGNIEKYNALSDKWKTQADLAANETQLREKISLLSLMELVFQSPAGARGLPFATIAAKAQIPVEQVELLVMKALSLGIVKGSIDQVEEIAPLHWVQPRVLDKQQLEVIKGRIAEWETRVNETSKVVENQTGELLDQ